MRKRLSDLDLNEAFGFATILAAFDAIERVFVVDLRCISFDQAAFFIYFFLFRLKMYIDDKNYDFKSDGIVGVSIAMTSWLLFLFSAASMGKSFYISMQWFLLALLISSLWVIYAWVRNCVNHLRYLRYLFVNTIHIGVFLYALIKYKNGIISIDFIDRGLLLILIFSVLVDWRCSSKCS